MPRRLGEPLQHQCERLICLAQPSDCGERRRHLAQGPSIALPQPLGQGIHPVVALDPVSRCGRSASRQSSPRRQGSPRRGQRRPSQTGGYRSDQRPEERRVPVTALFADRGKTWQAARANGVGPTTSACCRAQPASTSGTTSLAKASNCSRYSARVRARNFRCMTDAPALREARMASARGSAL